MEPLYDYIHQGGCYRYGVGWCRIQIYPGESAGDAPVVLCSELPEDRSEEMVERLAAEVIQDRFPSGLPDLPHPVLWIEYRSSRRGRGPGRYTLLTFPPTAPGWSVPALSGVSRSGLLGANPFPLARSRSSQAKSRGCTAPRP